MSNKKHQLFIKQKSFYSLLILFILLSFALFLRTFNLNREFSGDETILIGISQLKLEEIIPTLKQKDVYPPLTYLLVHHLMQFNSSTTWIRLYFVLFGLGTCLLIYLITKEYLNKKLARFALLLAVFSPLLIFASQYVRSYIDSTFWMLLTSLFMLKIIKAQDKLVNWAGYIISAALSLYTFYFSALLIFTQSIFVTIFKYKDKKLILKWYISLFIVGLMFLPWLFSAIAQFNNASSIDFDWYSKGFNFGALRFGMYTRNLFSLIGFDPYFMIFPGGITAHFNKLFLAIGVSLCFCLFIIFLYTCFNYLQDKFFGNKVMVWYPFFLIFVPVIISWVCSGLFNTLPNARYLVTFHAFFLILITVFIHRIWKKRPSFGIILSFLIFSIFLFRITYSVSSEFDTRGAISFLKENLIEQDCVVCVKSCPPKNEIINLIQLGDYLELKEDGSSFKFKSEKDWEAAKLSLSPFRRVWFYRIYSNVEIFGGNQVVDNLLKEQGYNPVNITKFKNIIDVIEYEKY